VKGNVSTNYRRDPMRGRIISSDRMQRAFLGLRLMILTILGFLEGMTWMGWLAVALQSESVITGVVGWSLQSVQLFHIAESGTLNYSGPFGAFGFD
jgi:hypothetical protein